MKEHLKKADLLGLAIIAAALIAYSVRGLWSVYQTCALIIGGALVFASVGAKSAEIKQGLGRRNTKFGINSATSVLLLLGVLGFVNYLGAQHPKRVDMTTEKTYSLSDQSVNVLSQLKEAVHIRAFYQGGEYQPVKDLLDLYKSRSGLVSYEFVDPDKEPGVAQQYQVTTYGDFQNPMTGASFKYGTLILEMGGKTERIEKQSDQVSEEDITNALLKIVKGAKKTIYFTDGHGEKKIDDTDKTGMSAAKAELEKQDIDVKSVNLVRENKVPDDASALVIAGPTAAFFPNELDMIDTYLKNGGSVLFMVDPAPGISLKDYLAKWDITVGDDIVVDASGVGRLVGTSPVMPLVTTYGRHAITEHMRVMTFFPLTRSITPAAKPEDGTTIDKLLETNEQSWGETDLKNKQAQYDEGKDLKGPVTIGVAITRNEANNKKARLVVVGDSDFPSNTYGSQAGNMNLFVNMATWLTRDENFISILPKTSGDRPLTMTEAQGRLVSYISVLLLPIGILGAGISVWLKRRR